MAAYTTWALQRAFVERLEIPDGEVAGSTAKFVLWAIQSFGHDECWPSVATLAEMTQMNPRTVQKAIGHLEAHQIVEVVHRPLVDGNNKSNLYRIRYDLIGSGSVVVNQNREGGGSTPPEPPNELIHKTRAASPIAENDTDAAFNALKKWAEAGGKPLRSGEVMGIHTRLTTLHAAGVDLKLVPVAVKFLMSKGTPFTGVGYALQSVNNAIAAREWEVERNRSGAIVGQPAANQKIKYGLDPA